MADNDELKILPELYEDLLNVGYKGEVKNFQQFQKCFNHGSPNPGFYDVAAYIGNELIGFLRRKIYLIPETREKLYTVWDDPKHPFKAPLADRLAFLVELSSLLTMLHCPVKAIMHGNISESLLAFEHQVVTLQYMIQELQAAKMFQIKGFKEHGLCGQTDFGKVLESEFLDSDFWKPGPHRFDIHKFDKMVCTLSQPLLPAERVGDILFSGVLTESQWFSLEKLYAEFFEEYRNRREMDITRVSVTISSFLWKDTVKEQSEKITGILNDFTENASVNPDVEISDMIAATADMEIGGSISSGAVCRNTRSTVNQVTIGDVPDRGGRPNEQAPPPPEIPSWMPRSQDPRPRGRPPFSGVHQASRGRCIQAGADPRNSLPRPVEVVAPRVAGDNFAQFGNNAPAPIGQHVLHGAPIVIPGNVQYQPQLGWGVPPPGFGGRGQAVRGQAVRGGPNAFHGQGAYGGQAARGGPNAFRGDGAHGGPNAFRGDGAHGGANEAGDFRGWDGPNAGFGGQGRRNAGQRGPGRHMRGGRGGRGNREGFGGFGGHY